MSLHAVLYVLREYCSSVDLQYYIDIIKRYNYIAMIWPLKVQIKINALAKIDAISILS